MNMDIGKIINILERYQQYENIVRQLKRKNYKIKNGELICAGYSIHDNLFARYSALHSVWSRDFSEHFYVSKLNQKGEWEWKG